MADFTEADRAALTRLQDEAAIRDVITRYTQGLDWMNWPQVEATLWPDAIADFGGMFKGDRAGFMPFVTQLEEGFTRRMHMFGLPRIALDGETAQVDAPSITHFRAVAGEHRIENFAVGRHLLKFEKRQGEWRMAHLLFILNSFRSTEEANADEGPLNLGDGIDQTSPLARGYSPGDVQFCFDGTKKRDNQLSFPLSYRTSHGINDLLA
jgi:hypothetical protein